MAADGTPGSKGNPQFLGAGALATAADYNIISTWAANNADVGVADVAALATVSPVWNGKRALTEDTGSNWVYWTGAWRLLNQPATAWTPVVTGLNLGTTGTKVGKFSIAGGICDFEAVLTAAGTGVTWADSIITPPVTASSPTIATPAGSAFVFDANGSNYAVPIGLLPDGTLRIYRVGADFGAIATWAGSTPFNLAAGDTIQISGRYRVA